jgi:sulfur-carrier protein
VSGEVAVTVLLPAHLRNLARVPGPVVLEVAPPVTQAALLDALEEAHPVLGGLVRDRSTGRRRPFVRFFVGEEDRSHDPPDEPLPAVVAAGEVPFAIVGAMAGG